MDDGGADDRAVQKRSNQSDRPGCGSAVQKLGFADPDAFFLNTKQRVKVLDNLERRRILAPPKRDE
jgi:hypothetical protein